ncbi:uncharacterized protein C9orf43 homolog isoform X2 [Zalophus californianus]|uniref:Uncharacterized protein C9orf43 homolog isoform X2 n=1 Tax=Zalophus californianus TaxID=9704 RepID=A0A6P9FG99_ZALCA|nr:uncharacterized protein C9orf43 homolog isoform X2 [Zalophus californianus]
MAHWSFRPFPTVLCAAAWQRRCLAASAGDGGVVRADGAGLLPTWGGAPPPLPGGPRGSRFPSGFRLFGSLACLLLARASEAELFHVPLLERSGGLESCKIGFCPKPFVAMDLPDESQWDETTCKLAICQHPQCWATIRRIERGHPRILGSPCKTTPNDEDKLPVLTIVNMADSCIRAKRHAHHHLSGLTFTKPPSLLCPGSKLDSKFRGRPREDLPDKDLIDHPDRSPKVNHRLKKLSVLNLNETQLPSPQDVRNMVVIWIPEQPERHVSPAEKKHILPSQDWMKKRTKSAGKDSFRYGKQKTETQLGPPGMIVPPPPSPVHFFEQLNAESIPFWNQFDTLPRDLLKDLLPDEGKTMPSLEMKTQLAMMKKKAPLEKSRPDSAISAKMFLSIHRLTLQRPALRYPKHLKKLYYTPNIEGHRTLLSQKTDKKHPQWTKSEGPNLEKDSTRRPQMEYSENYLDSFPDKGDPELSKIEPSNKDISTQEEVVPESQERSSEDLSDDTSRRGWNPELKLLRILQATDDEDEENQLSGSQSEESYGISQDSLTPEQDAWNPKDSDLGHNDRKERGLLLPGAFTRA